MMSDRANEMVACRDKDGNLQEVPVEKLQFRPSVYGIVIREGHVLLSPQWDGYDFPGGGMDIRERIEEALVREVKEETGLDVTPGPLVHLQEDFYAATKGRFFHSICMWHICTDPRGEISTEGFDEHEKEYAKAAQWVPIESVDSLKFYNPVDSPSLIRLAVEM